MKKDLTMFLELIAKSNTDFSKETLRFPHLGSASSIIKVQLLGICFQFKANGDIDLITKNLEK